jgi:hypothetical protein
LGAYKLETKYYEASEKLKLMDMTQYNLSKYINAISDPNIRDLKIVELIDIHKKMVID